MKFENDNWRIESPGPLPDPAVTHFWYITCQLAKQGRAQDILEEFKWRFSGGTAPRSSTPSDAEGSLSSLMHEAGENAPVFIEAFAEACKEMRELGLNGFPSVTSINHSLTMYNAGYQIEGDTIVARRWVAPQHGSQDAEPEFDGNDIDIDEYNESDRDAANPSPVAPPSLSGPMATRPIIPVALAPAKPPKPVPPTKPLKAFICHAKEDKATAMRLYRRLKRSGHEPWLDAVNLVAGQDWDAEIRKAVTHSDVVVVCLSQTSINKAGFVQKELRYALDVAEEQPEGRIYIIPVRLEECEVPERLRKWHWIDLFRQRGYQQLLAALNKRAAELP